jgi:hypothetical protein
MVTLKDEEGMVDLYTFDPATEDVISQGSFPEYLGDDGLPPSWRGHVLTVGYLRALLDGLGDDEHVVIATRDWFVNIEAVARPDINDDEGGVWSALTLFPGSKFDSRQL